MKLFEANTHSLPYFMQNRPALLHATMFMLAVCPLFGISYRQRTIYCSGDVGHGERS